MLWKIKFFTVTEMTHCTVKSNFPPQIGLYTSVSSPFVVISLFQDVESLLTFYDQILRKRQKIFEKHRRISFSFQNRETPFGRHIEAKV